MACIRYRTGAAARRFDRFWPADLPFPPTAPWAGVIAPRAEAREAFLDLASRYSRTEILALVENGEPKVNSPLTIVAGGMAIVAGAVLIYVLVATSDTGKDSKDDKDDTGESESEDGEGEGGGEEEGFWDPDGGCPRMSLC